MQPSRSFLQYIFLFPFIFFLVSCLPKSGNISLRYDDQVEIDLTKGKLQSGLTYFYSGPEAEPHTIIGIADKVSFQHDLWQPAQQGKAQVLRWLESIDNRHRSITDMYSGGSLVDGEGKILGVWFSKYRFFSGFITSEGKLVIRRPLRDKKGEIFGSERK